MEPNVLLQMQEPGCDLFLAKDHLTFRVSCEQSALRFIRRYGSFIPLWTQRFGCHTTLIEYPNCKRPYRIPVNVSLAFNQLSYENLPMTTPIIATPGLQIARMKISRPILEVL